MAVSWWHHQTETLSSALLALCEGNPPVTGGFPSPKASDAELWCFLWYAPEQTVERTIETPGIWDAIALIMTSPAPWHNRKNANKMESAPWDSHTAYISNQLTIFYRQSVGSHEIANNFLVNLFLLQQSQHILAWIDGVYLGEPVANKLHSQTQLQDYTFLFTTILWYFCLKTQPLLPLVARSILMVWV